MVSPEILGANLSGSTLSTVAVLLCAPNPYISGPNGVIHKVAHPVTTRGHHPLPSCVCGDRRPPANKMRGLYLPTGGTAVRACRGYREFHFCATSRVGAPTFVRRNKTHQL